MRLIYERGRRVGPLPVGRYIYLWRHGSIDRYIGKGANGRWSAHLKTGANDANQRKSRYFTKHAAELSCYLIAEDLESDRVTAQREIAEIDARGLERDGAGTLLNDRRGSVMPGPRLPRKPAEAGMTKYQQWRAMTERNILLLVPDAVFRRAGRALNGNPKSPNCGGAMYLDLYPSAGETITVAEMLAKGRALGIKDKAQLGHLAWDLEHGFIEIIAQSPGTGLGYTPTLSSKVRPAQAQPEPTPSNWIEKARREQPQEAEWSKDAQERGWTMDRVRTWLQVQAQSHPHIMPEPWPGYWMEYAKRLRGFAYADAGGIDAAEAIANVRSLPLVMIADMLRRDPDTAFGMLPDSLKPPLTPPPGTP